MRAHVLQHVSFEGLGSIGSWLSQKSAHVTCTRFFESEPLPRLEGIDLIIALGGPMSVNDEEQYPWLQEEKCFIAEAISSGKTVLGICLGSQLIANALGSRVYPGEEKEIGWFSILGEPDIPDTFEFPATTTVFHWHGETFDLPEEAVRLASSAACRNQAFQVGARAIGLQFHLETTCESANEIIGSCANELIAGRYIQTEQTLRSTPEASYAEINALMTKVLDYLVRDEG
jgi:GMP synthase-like glutamine amidotransferase